MLKVLLSRSDGGVHYWFNWAERERWKKTFSRKKIMWGYANFGWRSRNTHTGDVIVYLMPVCRSNVVRRGHFDNNTHKFDSLHCICGCVFVLWCHNINSTFVSHTQTCSQSFPCAGRALRNAFLSHGPYPAKDKIHLARIIRWESVSDDHGSVVIVWHYLCVVRIR